MQLQSSDHPGLVLVTKPLTVYTCGAAKLISEMDMNEKLIQFLMGLNDEYDNARNQLLVQDPLPTMNRAYSMILRVEHQRKVHQSFPEISENAAMLSKSQNYGRSYYNKGASSSAGRNGGRGRANYRRTKEERAKLHCEYCRENGHGVDECFKLHGYPDWFLKMKEQRGKSVANMADTPLNIGMGDPTEEERRTLLVANISNLIQQEIAKYMKENMHVGAGSGVNFAHFGDFAGPAE